MNEAEAFQLLIYLSAFDARQLPADPNLARAKAEAFAEAMPEIPLWFARDRVTRFARDGEPVTVRALLIAWWDHLDRMTPAEIAPEPATKDRRRELRALIDEVLADKRVTVDVEATQCTSGDDGCGHPMSNPA